MYKFYLLLLIELVLLPFLYLKEFLIRYISWPEAGSQIRQPVSNNNLIIGIHDWAGYDLYRKKVVNDIKFDCGLQCQLDRLTNYKGSKNIKLSLTISGADTDNY